MPPDDFDGQVTDHLTLLRTDAERVAWADSATIRAHGTRRQAQKAATTGLVLVAGVGILGYSAIVGVPGHPVVLGNPFLAASPSDSTRTPRPPVQRPPETGPAARIGPPHVPFLPDSAEPSAPLQGPSGLPSPSGPAPSTGTEPEASPTDSPAPTPTPEPPTGDPTPAPLTADALLAASEMPKVDDSDQSWVSTSSQSGEGSPVSTCVSGDLASLGATSAVRGDYTWGPGGPVTGTDVASVFPSSAEAASAYDTYASWLNGCTWGTAHGPTDVNVGDQAGWWWITHDNGDGTGQIEVVGLVRTGATMGVVVWRQDGQELSYTDDPMEPTLKAVDSRLGAYAGS